MRKSAICLVLALLPFTAAAETMDGCKELPSYSALKTALKEAREQSNGGLNNEMWGAIVDRTGKVCAVAYTGETIGSQWPGSRLVSAQKANTANAFSLPNMPLSTANLYAGSQPGGFLFGLQESNPINVQIAFKGPAEDFGSDRDPLVGQMIGGVNVFGGGLALYNASGKILGGIGVSGDTSCADHNIAWRARHNLQLDFVPAGVSPDKNDQIIYDINLMKTSSSGFGHPTCGGKEDDIAKDLPKASTAKKAAD